MHNSEKKNFKEIIIGISVTVMGGLISSVFEKKPLLYGFARKDRDEELFGF